MTYRGRVKNGVIILDPPATLPEGEEVLVNVTREKTLAEALGDVIGSIKDGPSDASEHHDHYLYGTPKK